MATEDGTTTGREQRVLVVVAEALSIDALREELGDRDAGAVELRIVAPALTDTAFKHALGDIDQAVQDAERRLERSLDAVRKAGFEASGAVGDSDPLVAIEDSLATHPADEVLIVTHRDDEAVWKERDVFDRAKHEIEPPITHVVVGRSPDDVVDVERAGAGTEESEEREVLTRSRNFPPFSTRDLLGTVVAIVGTGVLVVLAAGCPGELEEGGSSDASCTARAIIAGAMGLINVAHVVALFLFQSVRYRGGWDRFFAELSLFGTPAAIIASLIIG